MVSEALIAGLTVLGVLILLTIIGLAIYFILRRRRSRRNFGGDTDGDPGPVPVRNLPIHDVIYPDRSALYKCYAKSIYGRPSVYKYCALPKPPHIHSGTLETYDDANNPRTIICPPKIDPVHIRKVNNDRHLSETAALSKPRSVQNKISLVIRNKACCVYGEKQPFEQILRTAQNYYKFTTNTDQVVPTKDVLLVNEDTLIHTPISRAFTADYTDVLPTSYLVSSDMKAVEDAFSANKGVFVHKTVGIKGGRIAVSGVRLDIPAGALECNTRISLGVIWDERYVPTMTKKQAMLSPVVLCQPSGLTFKIPVTLTFPHAATRINQDWFPIVLKREGPLSEQNEWEPMNSVDNEDRKITETYITLKLYHFTLYALVGESQPGKTAAKMVHIVAFTGKLQKDVFFKPRVFCLNRYMEELEEVKTLTEKMDLTSKMAETTNLIVHDNEEDVSIEVHKLSEDWNLTSGKTEVLPFEQVWHSFHPHCTFVMKQTNTDVQEILCELHAYQNGTENNCAKLTIAEQMNQSRSPLSSPEADHVEGLIRQLVIMLDPINSIGTDAGDWKDLASKLGCGMARVRWLGTQSSPTRILLEEWFEDKRGEFDELEEIMNDINRPDAAEEVRNVKSNLNQDSATNDLS